VLSSLFFSGFMAATLFPVYPVVLILQESFFPAKCFLLFFLFFIDLSA